MKTLPTPTRRILHGALALFLTALATDTRAAVQADPDFHIPTDPELQGIYWCHLLPDGKVLTGGYRAFRLNSDGSLDTTFPVLTTPEAFIQKPVLEPGGGLTAYGSYYDEVQRRVLPFVKRYTSNGLVDSTFTPDFSAFSEVYLLQRDTAGRYLITGRAAGSYSSSVRRLLASGATDPAFQPLTDFSANAIAPIENGGWLVFGIPVSEGGSATGSAQLVRLRTDGTVLSRHDVEAGPLNFIPARRIIPLENGNILFGAEYPLVGVLRRDGKLASGFQAIYGEGPSDPAASAIVRLRDGRIMVSATSTGPYLAHTPEWPLPEDAVSWPAANVFRVLPDGMLDLSFDFRSVQQYTGAYDLAVQSDGKFLSTDDGTLRRFIETPSLPIFAFGDEVVVAKENGRRFAAIPVYRTGAVQNRSAVTIATVAAGSTGIPFRDYFPIRYRLNFDRGQWKTLALVPLRDDRIADGTKTVVLRLSQPDANSQLYSTDTLTIQIIDNE